MKKNIAILVTIGTVALAACGSKTDANEKNFSAAMSHYFDKKGDQCLKGEAFPVDLNELAVRLQESMASSQLKRMAALEAAGLVKGEDAEVDIKGWNQAVIRKEKVRRYTLTDAAKPFLQEREVTAFGLNGTTRVTQTDLCWGKKTLDKIVKWEGPMKFGDYQEAVITYTYKVHNVADWAKRPDVLVAFPYMKTVLDGAGSTESRHALKLTSEGWEAKGLD